MCRLRNGDFNVFVCMITVCRYNLDPFNNYKDEELWLALEKTYMKDTVKTHSIQGPQAILDTVLIMFQVHTFLDLVSEGFSKYVPNFSKSRTQPECSHFSATGFKLD